MKVLFVANNINVPGNGIRTSVNATVSNLRKSGIDVRVLSGISNDPDEPQPDFPLERFHFPIFQPIIDANGFCFAKRERKVIRRAVEWADVIHITEPFLLQTDVIRIADKMKKPVVGTFHLYTQNVLNEIPLISCRWTNDILMKIWRNCYFDRCRYVQCPTQEVKSLLERYGFKAGLEVISNGIETDGEPVQTSESWKNPYIILNVGRFVNIKSQMTLLEAMKYSRHSREIQLYFAGHGVNDKKMKRFGLKLVQDGVLNYEPVRAFHLRPELTEVERKAYLYVHCAKMEVEGLGCLEAIKQGAVPVIARGEMIGTSDFALDDRSLYPVGDAKVLAEKIDWWIEHPEERIEAGRRYVEFVRKFDIRKSINALIEMYKKALAV